MVERTVKNAEYWLHVENPFREALHLDPKHSASWRNRGAVRPLGTCNSAAGTLPGLHGIKKPFDQDPIKQAVNHFLVL